MQLPRQSLANCEQFLKLLHAANPHCASVRAVANAGGLVIGLIAQITFAGKQARLSSQRFWQRVLGPAFARLMHDDGIVRAIVGARFTADTKVVFDLDDVTNAGPSNRAGRTTDQTNRITTMIAGFGDE